MGKLIILPISRTRSLLHFVKEAVSPHPLHTNKMALSVHSPIIPKLIKLSFLL